MWHLGHSVAKLVFQYFQLFEDIQYKIHRKPVQIKILPILNKQLHKTLMELDGISPLLTDPPCAYSTVQN